MRALCPNVMRKTAALGVLAWAAWCPSARAATLHVPTEYPDIETAIASAHDGDEILLGEGCHTFWRDAVVDGGVLTIEGNPGSCIHIPEAPLTAGNGAFLVLRNVRLAGALHAEGNSTLVLEGVELHAPFPASAKAAVTAVGAASVTVRSSVLASVDLRDVSRVRIENSALTGASGSAGLDGLRLEGCPKATLANSSIAGGDGACGADSRVPSLGGDLGAGRGGNGMTALDGTVVTFVNSRFSAGLGGSPAIGRDGADGVATFADRTSTIIDRSTGTSPPAAGAKVESAGVVAPGQ